MSQTAPLVFDVRPIIGGGEEPFSAIMTAVDKLGPGQSLRILAPFRPAPLFNVMANLGFGCRDRQRSDGVWEVDFTPVATAAADPDMAPGSAPEAALWPEPARMLDLVELPPPEPMVQILESLAGMQTGEVLFALLGREPMFLFPELAHRGHEWAGNFCKDGEAYRLLIRVGAADE